MENWTILAPGVLQVMSNMVGFTSAQEDPPNFSDVLSRARMAHSTRVTALGVVNRVVTERSSARLRQKSLARIQFERQSSSFRVYEEHLDAYGKAYEEIGGNIDNTNDETSPFTESAVVHPGVEATALGIKISQDSSPGSSGTHTDDNMANATSGPSVGGQDSTAGAYSPDPNKHTSQDGRRLNQGANPEQHTLPDEPTETSTGWDKVKAESTLSFSWDIPANINEAWAEAAASAHPGSALARLLTSSDSPSRYRPHRCSAPSGAGWPLRATTPNSKRSSLNGSSADINLPVRSPAVGSPRPCSLTQPYLLLPPGNKPPRHGLNDISGRDLSSQPPLSQPQPPVRNRPQESPLVASARRTHSPQPRRQSTPGNLNINLLPSLGGAAALMPTAHAPRPASSSLTAGHSRSASPAQHRPGGVTTRMPTTPFRDRELSCSLNGTPLLTPFPTPAPPPLATPTNPPSSVVAATAAVAHVLTRAASPGPCSGPLTPRPPPRSLAGASPSAVGCRSPAMRFRNIQSPSGRVSPRIGGSLAPASPGASGNTGASSSTLTHAIGSGSGALLASKQPQGQVQHGLEPQAPPQQRPSSQQYQQHSVRGRSVMALRDLGWEAASETVASDPQAARFRS